MSIRNSWRFTPRNSLYKS